jgi:hypothetical protein
MKHRSWRRNLTKSQAVACAVEMLPVFEAEAKARQGKRTDLEHSGPGSSKSARDQQARDRAANVFGVSGRHVQRAKKLQQTAPQLLDGAWEDAA